MSRIKFIFLPFLLFVLITNPTPCIDADEQKHLNLNISNGDNDNIFLEIRREKTCGDGQGRLLICYPSKMLNFNGNAKASRRFQLIDQGNENFAECRKMTGHNGLLVNFRGDELNIKTSFDKESFSCPMESNGRFGIHLRGGASLLSSLLGCADKSPCDAVYKRGELFNRTMWEAHQVPYVDDFGPLWYLGLDIVASNATKNGQITYFWQCPWTVEFSNVSKSVTCGEKMPTTRAYSTSTRHSTPTKKSTTATTKDVVKLLNEDWKCAKLQACAMIGGKGKCKEKDMNEEECKNDETGKCKREGKVCTKVDGTEVCAEVSKVSEFHDSGPSNCKVPRILGDEKVHCRMQSIKNICAKDGTKMCVEVKEMMSLRVRDENGKKMMNEISWRKALANVGKEIHVLKNHFSRTECTEKVCVEVVDKYATDVVPRMCPKEMVSSYTCVDVDSKEGCVKECAKMGGTMEKCVQLCAIYWYECTNQQVAKWQAKVLALMQEEHKLQRCTKQCSVEGCLAVCDTDEECTKNCTQYFTECKNACMAEPEKPCEKCKCTKYEKTASVKVCNPNGICHQASWEKCVKWWSTVCKWHKRCFRDQDCGEIGFCEGFDLGKCDCTSIEDDPLACIQGEKCNAVKLWHQPPPCGGLEGACNKTSNLCDCEMGFRKAGYKGTADAMANFCAKKECDGDPERETTDDCFGFPCMSGLCTCKSRNETEKGMMSANIIEEPKWKMAKVQPKNNDE